MKTCLDPEAYWEKKIEFAAKIAKDNDFEVYDEAFWKTLPAGVISLLIKASKIDFPYELKM